MNYNSFFNKVACGLLVCKNDPYSTIIEANDAFYNMVGYTRKEMKEIHNNQFTGLVLNDLSEIMEKVMKASVDKKVLDLEYRIRHKSGKVIWIHDMAIYDLETNTFNVAIMDITYKEKILKSISKAAEVDKMTGLLNRNTLENKIKTIIGENLERKSQTMFLIDLDNFKSLNDLRGHQEGDKLLTQIGLRLKKEFRSNDIIGRLGGDEFMIFIKDLKNREMVSRIAEKIRKTLEIEVYGIGISASIGICMDIGGKLSFDELYSLSDRMLYRVKGNKGDHYKIEMIP